LNTVCLCNGHLAQKSGRHSNVDDVETCTRASASTCPASQPHEQAISSLSRCWCVQRSGPVHVPGVPQWCAPGRRRVPASACCNVLLGHKVDQLKAWVSVIGPTQRCTNQPTYADHAHKLTPCAQEVLGTALQPPGLLPYNKSTPKPLFHP